MNRADISTSPLAHLKHDDDGDDGGDNDGDVGGAED